MWTHLDVSEPQNRTYANLASMYSRPLFTQNPNTAAEQAGVTERKTRGRATMCTFTETDATKMCLIHSSPFRAGRSGSQKWALNILCTFSDGYVFFLILTHPDKLHFGLARFDCIHIPPEWNVSAVVKVTDKIRSKWVLNELAFNNAKYAKPGLAF